MSECQCSECREPDRYLYYFKCKHCQSVLVTSIKSDRPERCRCSGSWMVYAFTARVTSEEERALHARGRVWNPHRPPPWTCVRCGATKDELPHVRPDGYCCEACYRAEEQPPLTESGSVNAENI